MYRSLGNKRHYIVLYWIDYWSLVSQLYYIQNYEITHDDFGRMKIFLPYNFRRFRTTEIEISLCTPQRTNLYNS